MLFHKDKDKTNALALINSDSKINTMTPVYISKLGFKVQKINISAQKKDSFSLKTNDIVLAAFQVLNKLVCF